MGNYFNIRNNKIYIDILGENKNTPILYIHGAPGIGVTDFISIQGDNFAKSYYLIAPEQHGVWRSQELEEDYSITKVIEDYEEIRKALKIENWMCIAHCLGARTAIKYYNKHPDVFKLFIFESPIFDSLTPFSEMIKLELKMLKEKQGIDAYNKYLAEANSISNPLSLESFSYKLGRELNINTNAFTMSQKTMKQLATLKQEFDYNLFMKSRSTEVKMSHNIDLYSKIDEDFKNIEIPMLLIKGDKDIVVPNKSLENFISAVKQSKSIIFDNCKHWIHLDEPKKYFETVDNFIKTNLLEVKK